MVVATDMQGVIGWIFVISVLLVCIKKIINQVRRFCRYAFMFSGGRMKTVYIKNKEGNKIISLSIRIYGHRYGTEEGKKAITPLTGLYYGTAGFWNSYYLELGSE